MFAQEKLQQQIKNQSRLRNCILIGTSKEIEEIQLSFSR
jgi:hypothetical protein